MSIFIYKTIVLILDFRCLNMFVSGYFGILISFHCADVQKYLKNGRHWPWTAVIGLTSAYLNFKLMSRSVIFDKIVFITEFHILLNTLFLRILWLTV